MKVALVHDYLKEYGGAERVLEALKEIWPEAPVYTSVFLPKHAGPHEERLRDWKVVPSWFQKLPFKERLISPLRLISPWAFESFDFSHFDVVVVSATGAYAPNMIVTQPETLHLCYCHTPPRYLYGYPTARQLGFLGKIASNLICHLLRPVDYLSSQRVDCFVANSQNTASRIKKFYRQDATVIYPPVDLPQKVKSEKGEYFLTGGRLAYAKRFDLVVEACTKLNLPLKVFGRAFAGYGEELKKLAGPTVEFVGEVSEEEKKKLFANCKAYIFPALDEDFGITPVEAMAYGKPVIALKQGGVIETVIAGKTGEFFGEPLVESLVHVLKDFKAEKYKTEDCRKQAEKFSKERFKKEMADFVNKKWQNYAR